MPNSFFENQGLPVEFSIPPEIPWEWVELLGKLNPITAVVAWELLTNNLSPASITLARFSPDLERYLFLKIVAGGNPSYCEEIAQLARPELDDVFADYLPGFDRKKSMQ